ncbi:hypothetical protein CS542_08010 [Pedobacter sp. IW39]|nr:hypothetical protein CS542_08010 [Pedobacter sp. IW39]
MERLRRGRWSIHLLRKFQVPNSEARYSFGISFGCSPQNVEKLIAQYWDEINKLKVGTIKSEY